MVLRGEWEMKKIMETMPHPSGFRVDSTEWGKRL